MSAIQEEKPRSNGQCNQRPLRRKDVYTMGEIARLARVAPRTVGGWFDSGQLAGYRVPRPTGIPGDRRCPHKEVVRFLREHGFEIPAVLRDQMAILLVGATRMLADTLHLAGDGRGWDIHEGGLVRAGSIASAQALAAVVIDAAGLGRRAALDAAAAIRDVCSENHCAAPRFVFVLGEDETARHEFTALGDAFLRPFDAALLVERLEALVESVR